MRMATTEPTAQATDVRTLNRNPDLLTLGALMGKTLRQGPDLGLVRETSISVTSGFWVTLHLDEQKPAAALLAWAELLKDPVIEARVQLASVTTVTVTGQLEDVRTVVLASFTSETARRELAVDGQLTVATLERLQNAGAR